MFILSLNYFAHFSFYFLLTFTCCHALLIIFAWKRRVINFKLLLLLLLLLLLTSFIMSNGSLRRHGNSLGIQIFLTYLTKSEANASLPDKFKWSPLEFRCSPVILGCEIIFQSFWLANVLRMLWTRCLALELKEGSSVLGNKFEIATFVLKDLASMKFPRSTFLSDQINSEDFWADYFNVV